MINPRDVDFRDMGSTPIAALRRIRARLKRGWCQRANALDLEGHPVGSCNPRARRWCLAGATVGECEDARIYIYRALTTGEKRYRSVIEWNDCPGRTQEDVIAMVGRAIRMAEADARKEQTRARLRSRVR